MSDISSTLRKRKLKKDAVKDIKSAKDDCCSKGKTPDGKGKKLVVLQYVKY
jgi:hypothetical protein